ncbi:hypothetical protein OCGS_1309 [Oceaniovalibus guishaninsula JLT2003]|uniref:DAGKc domain-containing protein n=1 Tax=Oceaniovalibus guishaninsula JLT2003 TaxID=1231392 RepID=K2GP44_9RHOB|nr:diacylglycerol kinase family protein [Oceaniovalibus guishaninsula]EKE44471.1 hypothetical protein OCGS_1309 [Oceaniovalibus guishaninsula JLT2003]
MPDQPTDPTDRRSICVIANRKSGRNSRDRAAIEDALATFGDGARLVEWGKDDDIACIVDRAVGDGADLIVAAGGDGTAMAVAGAMLGRNVPMAVLPLGTFNFFARGLGLSEDPKEAARQILAGGARDIRIGTANGRPFLNNASLGVYPAILKERETVYRRWGRRRIAAHWSVAKTFLRFQRPMDAVLRIDGGAREIRVRTALIFVARSIYQLDSFGLKGAGAIHDDAFAVLIAKGETRARLFRLAWRLATGRAEAGREYDFVPAREMEVTLRRPRALLAYDGEKTRAVSPFVFRMSDRPLRIVLP